MLVSPHISDQFYMILIIGQTVAIHSQLAEARKQINKLEENKQVTESELSILRESVEQFKEWLLFGCDRFVCQISMLKE